MVCCRRTLNAVLFWWWTREIAELDSWVLLNGTWHDFIVMRNRGIDIHCWRYWRFLWNWFWYSVWFGRIEYRFCFHRRQACRRDRSRSIRCRTSFEENFYFVGIFIISQETKLPDWQRRGNKPITLFSSFPLYSLLTRIDRDRKNTFEASTKPVSPRFWGK